MFDLARAEGLIWDLEVACRSVAIKKIAQIQKTGRSSKLFFFNVSPYVFQDLRFIKGFTLAQMQMYGIEQGSIVAPRVTFGLDSSITIGENVSIGPDAILSTATHALGFGSRRMQLDLLALPIIVEDGVGTVVLVTEFGYFCRGGTKQLFLHFDCCFLFKF